MVNKVKNIFTAKNGLKDLIDHVQKNPDCQVVASLGNGVIITKRLKLSVNVKNDTAIFGPDERIEKKSYCVMAILEYKPVDDSCYDCWPLQKLGCPLFIVNTIEDVDKAIKTLR